MTTTQTQNPNTDYLLAADLHKKQREAFDDRQVENNSGGFVFKQSSWDRLNSFLILGSASNTYYTSSHRLTKENVSVVLDCIREDGPRAVAITKEISLSGRAPKNDPAIFVLALAAADKSEETRRAALAALPAVCRTSTHLFFFLELIRSQKLRGFGRALRSAVANWYQNKEIDKLAYQTVKYRQRNGWTHRDVLRLAHPRTDEPARNELYRWITSAETSKGLPRIIKDFEKLSAAKNTTEVVSVLKSNPNIPWEAIPTDFYNDREVWQELFDQGMPNGALLRQLPRLSKLGIFGSFEQRNLTTLKEAFLSEENLKAARIHPLQILLALSAYKDKPESVPEVVDILDEAFYLAFSGLEPTGKNFLLGLDVSGSMSWGSIAGSGLSPRDASAALALASLSTGDPTEILAFSHQLVPLKLSRRQRLDDAIETISRLPFGGTDCALPMIYAKENKLDIDAFIVYTDSETWYGDVHPVQALEDYRQSSGRDAKLIVNGMVANGFSIADPDDPGMLDVVGFDAATPELISSFASGGWSNG